VQHISKTTLARIFNIAVALVCLLAFFIGQAHAAWY